jgi:VanZ family protein
MAMLFVLAALATGGARLWLAAVLTFLVGVGWEIAQTTVIGHNPRVVDLFPNLVGIALGGLVVSVAVFLWRASRSRFAGAG